MIEHVYAGPGQVLDTGAAGLVRGAVCAQLRRLSIKVVGVDRVSSQGPNGAIIACDLTEAHRLHEIVGSYGIASIVHCGALSGPMVARDDPSAMVAVNILGTANVLEVARIHKMRRFVYCSSTSAYGVIRSEAPIGEFVALRPTTLYGASKAACERLVAAYRSQYGLQGTSLRLSWVYGPRRVTDCAIREMIMGALRGENVSMAYGRDFYRQYIYVDDAARALVAALRHGQTQQDVYNVTGGTWVTLAQVADVVRSVFPEACISLAPGPDPVDDEQSEFDIGAARADLGYTPEVSLASGVRLYADWLKESQRLDEE